MKKTVSVFFGGQSTEYEISLQSAYGVMSNIHREKYEVIPIGITRDGEWYRYDGPLENILEDTWSKDSRNLHKVAFSQSRSDHGFLELTDGTYRLVRVDLAFPVLHGKNGEDGTVQGLIEIAGIPLVGCNTLSSALCMDKGRAHKLAELAGVRVPKSVTFLGFEKEEGIRRAEKEIPYPLFVKPVRAGSSFGITKVYNHEQFVAAVDLALEHDREVVVEETIEGFEIGCAVLGTEELLVGRIDEVDTARDLFDYEEKYIQKVAPIRVPANLSESEEKLAQETAKTIYRALDCSGFARVDMFYSKDGEIIFNEVNSIPGMTSHSRYPSMMKAVGLSFADVLEKLLGLYD